MLVSIQAIEAGKAMMRHRKICMKVGLRWVMGLCCLLLAPPGVLADTGQSADMRVWSVVYQQGEGQVSEIWVHHNGEDRAVGILPGRAERLVPLDASHFRCDVAAITLPFFGSPGRHVWALAPPTSWEIGLDRSCREIERVAPGETPPSIAPVGHDSASKRVMQVLGGVEEALHHARMAYSYLHQWDFRNASEGYHTASQKVKPGRFSGGQVLGPPFEKMAEGLESLAVEAKKEGPRRVCRDHLQMLGEWALTYRSAHGMFWPEDAAVLCDWIDSRGGDNRLFRSPEDRGAQRRFSYLYRPQAQVGEAVFISPFYQGRILELVKTEAGFRVLDRVAGKAQVDSLLAAGRSQLEPAEAVAIFSMVTRIDPTSAEGFSQLGYACLRAGDVDRARASFEQAVDIDHRLASAYNGLGLVFENHPKGRYDAIRFFRRAIQYDEEFVEARFNMARMRFALKEHDAKRDLDRVIALDQNYAPAFLLLGEWYEALEEDYGNAAVAYARYLALRPDDAEGRRRLAATYVRTQDFDKVTSLLEVYAREHPNEVEILPILAQACMDQDRLDWAQAYFSTYVRSAPDSLGRCYSDIRLLATAEEQAEYGALDPEARERYLREFWSVRDPNLTTAANERQLEHYRRVWYSLTNYSNGRRPWDRRGEVY
ncbi:MAG: tetratricopeptide repeat protein, partial [bacterium]|nr:tetratricopeptide repeat protein [bacterium]